MWKESLHDEQQFRRLFDSQFDQLFTYGLKLHQNQSNVKDAIQDIFVDLWAKRKQRTNIKNIHAYLLRAIRYRLLKGDSKIKVINIDSYSDSLAYKKDLPEQDHKKALQSVLDLMPERQREVLHLKYFQGLTNPEIAEVLGVNMQSVSNVLQRAYESFRKKTSKKNLFG